MSYKPSVCLFFFLFEYYYSKWLFTVHGYEKAEQESEKTENTLWGKEHAVSHLKVVQSTMGLHTGAGWTDSFH